MNGPTNMPRRNVPAQERQSASAEGQGTRVVMNE